MFSYYSIPSSVISFFLKRFANLASSGEKKKKSIPSESFEVWDGGAMKGCCHGHVRFDPVNRACIVTSCISGRQIENDFLEIKY